MINWEIGQKVRINPLSGVFPSLVSMFPEHDFTLEDEVVQITDTASLNIQCAKWDWMSDGWLLRKDIDYE